MTTTEHSIGAAFEYAVRARRDGIAREIILRDLVAMGIESDEVSEFLDTCWYGFLHGWGTEFVLEATAAGADRADIIENMVAMGFQESEAPEFYEQVLQEFQERLGDEIQDAVASGVEAAFDNVRRALANFRKAVKINPEFALAKITNSRRLRRQAIEDAIHVPMTYEFVEEPLGEALKQLAEQHQVELIRR